MTQDELAWPGTRVSIFRGPSRAPAHQNEIAGGAVRRRDVKRVAIERGHGYGRVSIHEFVKEVLLVGRDSIFQKGRNELARVLFAETVRIADPLQNHQDVVVRRNGLVIRREGRRGGGRRSGEKQARERAGRAKTKKSHGDHPIAVRTGARCRRA